MRNFIYLLTFCSSIFLFACEEYDEDILPIVGTYEASIIGVTGPFNMAISTTGGDNIRIDALFDGFDYFLVDADIDDEEQRRKEIDIDYQEIAPNVFIEGRGVYFDFTVQLDYTLEDPSGVYDFTLVGSQF